MMTTQTDLQTQQELIQAYETTPLEGFKRLKLTELDLPTHTQVAPLTLAKPLQSILDGEATIAPLPSHKEVNRKLFYHNQAFYNTGIRLELEENQHLNNPLYIKLPSSSDDTNIIDYNLITLGKNSSATLIFHYKGDETTGHFHNGYTHITAHPYSQLKIVKIYEYHANSFNHDVCITTTDSHAKVQVVTADFTKGTSITNFIGELDQHSHTLYSSVYLGQDKTKMDHHYKMVHLGPHSESHIDVKGALTDYAKKIFRGTLDFQKGSKGSKGIENEYVTLLTPHVSSHAIPALLCSEDDVEGEHAASAGQIDESKLFYLMSRGLSLIEAKKLLVEASFAHALSQIPDQELQEHISALVLKGLDTHDR